MQYCKCSHHVDMIIPIYSTSNYLIKNCITFVTAAISLVFSHDGQLVVNYLITRNE